MNKTFDSMAIPQDNNVLNLHGAREQFSFPSAAVIYYVSIPFIYLIALVTFGVLYLFSDFLYFILFSCIGYRKKVVLQNLRNSFPTKTVKEINEICGDFYNNLCDCFLETVKTMTISKKSLVRRCKLSPKAHDVFSKFADEQQSIVMVMGHIGNWEWSCNAFNIQCIQQLFVIYHPISNKYFDRLMYRIRNRNGTRLIAMENTYKEMIAYKTGLNATVFVADQAPQPRHAYWTTFLNQDTPVYKGVEVFAKRMNLPVVYASVKKLKRGYYEMNAEVLAEDPENTLDGAISEMYIRRLETDIVAQPESWLWSHRRWKHARVLVS